MGMAIDAGWVLPRRSLYMTSGTTDDVGVGDSGPIMEGHWNSWFTDAGNGMASDPGLAMISPAAALPTWATAPGIARDAALATISLCF